MEFRNSQLKKAWQFRIHGTFCGKRGSMHKPFVVNPFMEEGMRVASLIQKGMYLPGACWTEKSVVVKITDANPSDIISYGVAFNEYVVGIFTTASGWSKETRVRVILSENGKERKLEIYFSSTFEDTPDCLSNPEASAPEATTEPAVEPNGE
ncbi:MAG: hypothetical protein V1716_00645 [Candidatus Uhrbacteria bacterium]